MQVGHVDRETLRRLAAQESRGAPVVSFYVDLNPSEYATPAARSAAVRSLVDEAGRRIEGSENLSHEGRRRGLEAVDRVREWFERSGFAVGGAHGIAVFAGGDDDLFETVRLPRSVPSELVVGRKPYVEPLLDMAAGARWCVLLASREDARVLRGDAERLVEVAGLREQIAGAQHDQAEASAEEDVDSHLRRVARLLYERFKRAPFEHLALGATSELAPRLERELHPDLRARLAGRIDVDVSNSGPDDVLSAARETMDEVERRREDEAFDRLRERLGDGRAASGLEDVLEALTEQRVETLLLAHGFSATGALCPRCGWLGGAEVERCPADGTPTERRDDIVELAIDRALAQSAAVLVPRRSSEVADRGGLAAILRF